MIATTLEQSRKLVELGIDPITADMSYINSSLKGLNYCDEFRLGIQSVNDVEKILDETFTDWKKDSLWQVIPAWSLSALLNLIPSHIGRNKLLDEQGNIIGYTSDNKEGGDIGWFYLHNDGKDWIASYGLPGNYVCLNPDSDTPPYINSVVYASSPIDAAFNMILWLKENKYI